LGQNEFEGNRMKIASKIIPSRASLASLLTKHGIQLKKQTLEQLWHFHQMLRASNEDQDLTRLNAFTTIVERHYADCFIINAFMESWPDVMLDVGSGAGFPGIPLKLANPQIHLTLCEPRPRRVEFLNKVISELGLTNIEVFGHKVTSNSMRTPVKGMISRAFEDMDKTLLRMENALVPGGLAVFMKGPGYKDELPLRNPGFTLKKVHEYTIPQTSHRRALVVVERLDPNAPVKEAVKTPLKAKKWQA
jgi:16S rRNA (guanine527-N7)-methyltransferase